MDNREVIVVSDTPEKPYLQSILEKIAAAGHKISKQKLSEVNIKECEASKCVLILDMTADAAEKVTFLERLQKMNITQDVSTFPIIASGTDTDTNELLEKGAADVLIENQGVERALLKLGQSIDMNLLPNDTDLNISTTPIPKALKNIKVLVIEDDVLLRNLLTTRLEQANIKCEFSTDGIDVPTIINSYQPSVILLDIMLPGKDGLDVLQEVRDAGHTNVPVIVFSNRDEQSDRKRAEELGAKEYYVKAMTDLSDLVKTIEAIAA